MWMRWLPWRYIVRRVARARGFIDPIAVWSRLHRFAEPAEVAAPLELLRAGVVFHARGLMNTAAIQHNLDWVWPYWVERQFDPLDESFIPRAFSITHVNLTHRNWTAIGCPDCESLPIVDPRGLLTPFWDGWSIDAWIVGENEQQLIPSRLLKVDQRLDLTDPEQISVVTQSEQEGMKLEVRACVSIDRGRPVCVQRMTASATEAAWLAVSLRPYNPEGVSFVHDVVRCQDDRGWTIDDLRTVAIDTVPDRHAASVYRDGDVYAQLPQAMESRKVRCDVGLCTAAALFELRPGETRSVTVRIPLELDAAPTPKPQSNNPLPSRERVAAQPPGEGGVGSQAGSKPQPVLDGRYPTWPAALAGHCELHVPDERTQFLYDAAVRTLILHSPGDVYPGPYTYKRFWFRDAVFILHALLCLGLTARVKRTLDRFPSRQTRAGYFLSQEGEWDSNGAALWMFHRYCQFTGLPPDPAWTPSIRLGAEWIERKRMPETLDRPHAGLLPAGFSAEHLGPNDFYYWDDFWGVAGLRSAAILEMGSQQSPATRFLQSAQQLEKSIDHSLERTIERRKQAGIPASPYRRMDSGAIGSLVGSYPLQIWSPRDPRMLANVDFLLKHCFVHDGFFQDMIHSGVNPYLTLHVAQVLLRAGDQRWHTLMQAVAKLATSTGQWPEAIHPRTLGGCMGDGQHVWAAAEWVMMVRNCFVREELDAELLVLGSGIPTAWLDAPEGRLAFGPTLTPWGTISVEIRREDAGVTIDWQGAWRGRPPRIEVRMPGFEVGRPAAGTHSLRMLRN